MTLPASGEITLNDVNVELGNTGTDAITIGSADVRDLFGVASGEITMADGYGKSSVYEIANSCRFNDNDSAHLSRTPSSTTNRRTWTWSGWVKFTEEQAGTQPIFAAGDGSTYTRITLITEGNHLSVMEYNGEWAFSVKSDDLIRDFTNWYHIVVAVDTTQATASNRVKMYINGEAVTSFFDATYPSQNFDTEMNNSVAHYDARDPDDYLDCYQADVHFIDGTALTPSSFGETGDYGEWKPIEYTGSYGTNGFYLDFADSGNLGDDESGNGNDFTSNNLSAYDQVLDSPTNNFCTFNRLQPSETGSPAMRQGNLEAHIGDNEEAFGTFGVSSGKWYFEMFHTGSGSSNNKIAIGIADADNPSNNEQVNHGHSGTTYGVGDIIGVAVNVDGETISFYKNNSIIETNTDWSGKGWKTIKPIVSSGNSAGDEDCVINFGQDSSFTGETTAGTATDSNGYGSFKYTPPTDYLALCSANLPDPTVTPSEHFNTVLYTGNNTARTISGVGFQPDFNIIRNRSITTNNLAFDAVRGASKSLRTDSASLEGSASDEQLTYVADGFTLGTGEDVNGDGDNIVSWCWKANGSGSSNTNGSITSTVSANQDAGFSIFTYTGSGANATIGHGLSKAPDMWVVKPRVSVSDDQWFVCHKGLDSTNHAQKFIHFDTGGAKQDNALMWNDTLPTATTIALGTKPGTNNSGGSFVGYAWHDVEGYSKFGMYAGNQDSSGPFLFTGFRPAFVVIQAITTGDDGWLMYDNKRDSDGNRNDQYLYINSTGGEYDGSAGSGSASRGIDFLSNGFKIRGWNSSFNYSGREYLYFAFAEQPFKYSNAK